MVGINILVGLVLFWLGYFLSVALTNSKVDDLEREKFILEKRYELVKETNIDLTKHISKLEDKLIAIEHGNKEEKNGQRKPSEDD